MDRAYVDLPVSPFAIDRLWIKVSFRVKWALLTLNLWPCPYEATAYWVGIANPGRLDLKHGFTKRFFFAGSMDRWVQRTLVATKDGKALRVVFCGRVQADWEEGERAIASDGLWFKPVGQDIEFRDGGIYVVDRA